MKKNSCWMISILFFYELTSINLHATFELERVCIQNNETGKFLSAIDGGGRSGWDSLMSDRDECRNWEGFEMINPSNGSTSPKWGDPVCLKTRNGHWVSINPETHEPNTKAETCGPNETFYLVGLAASSGSGGGPQVIAGDTFCLVKYNPISRAMYSHPDHNSTKFSFDVNCGDKRSQWIIWGKFYDNDKFKKYMSETEIFKGDGNRIASISLGRMEVSTGGKGTLTTTTTTSANGRTTTKTTEFSLSSSIKIDISDIYKEAASYAKAAFDFVVNKDIDSGKGEGNKKPEKGTKKDNKGKK